MSLDREGAVAYGVAAIRETFEEAGVLLAKQSDQSLKAISGISEIRLTKGLYKGWLRRWTEARNWVLEFARLGRWSHWITPKARSHRYDTRFFMALMPEDQECLPDARETTKGIWLSPEEGLESNLRGEIPLSPPALVTLHELLPYSRAEELERKMEGRPWGESCLSIFKRFPEGQLILLPEDPRYGEEDRIDPLKLKSRGLEVGKPFTRLWCQDGIWRPIAV